MTDICVLASLALSLAATGGWPTGHWQADHGPSEDPSSGDNRPDNDDLLLLRQQTILLDGTNTQIWYLTDPHTYGAANEAHAAFAGVPRDQLPSRHVGEIATPRTAAICLEGNVEAFEKGVEIRSEVWAEDSSGDMRCLAVVKSPRRDADGKLTHVVCTAQDVTEAKSAEADLRMQTSAIGAATDQIIITDLKGRIEFANPAFERETGYSLAETLGRNPRLLRSGRQATEFYTLMWNTILSGRTWHGELVNQRRDGSQYVAQTTITPVKSESGEIERFVAIARNITEKKRFEQRMDYLAHHDVLTDLPNRLLMGHKLSRCLAQASRRGNRAAVLFVDLNGFKQVNDTMGHAAGDTLLRAVAKRLKECCGDGDSLARMGGDEFIVVLPHVVGGDEAASFAQKILNVFSKPFLLERQEISLGSSVGISLYPIHGKDVETLVKNADTAMYRAKERGRNTFCFWHEDMAGISAERKELEGELIRAIEQAQLVVHYQPRVDIANSTILGAEALVRWKRPKVGLVQPNQFLPFAEETGLIVPISEYVLREAVKQNKAWQDQGLPPIEMAVNLSPRQFQSSDVLTTVQSALAESGLDARWLELEFTESTLVRQPNAAKVVRRIRELGVKIAVDDFGTGHSSLSHLTRFPVDSLKIDRSLVRNATTSPDDAAIISAMIAMAHSLDLRVIAEGVETLEQLGFLYGIHCDEMQGYFVSAPVCAEEFTKLLTEPEGSFETGPRLAA